jgi:phosphate transport system substrate-binding protein
VVSSQNTFVPDSLNKAQIRKIFTAEKWSDVDPKWPNQIIKRILPSKVSSNLGIAEVSRYFYLENEGNLLTNLPNTSFYDFAEQLHAKTLLEPYMFGVLEQITYRKNTDIYKSIAIDGVKSSQPNYPLTRVFYIYADANQIRQRPELKALLQYYLTYSSEVSKDLGIFPVKDDFVKNGKTQQP